MGQHRCDLVRGDQGGRLDGASDRSESAACVHPKVALSEVCSVLNNNGRFPEALFFSLFSGVLRWGIPQRCEISLLFTRQQMCETVAPGEGDWMQLLSRGGGGRLQSRKERAPAPPPWPLLQGEQSSGILLDHPGRELCRGRSQRQSSGA